jgi:phosphate transport system permease protein
MHIKQKLEESFFKILMVISTIFVLGSLLLILGTVLWRGLPALDLAMLTQIPQGGYYLGKEGGILNAILGSLCLAGGATIVAVILSLPIALYLQLYPIPHFTKDWIRLSLDILWGIPSIVYGAIGFTVMIFLGMRASLLGGIIVLSLLELPIMVRGMEEAVSMVPKALLESSYSLGATRFETAFKVVVRQTLPGLVTAILLAFGRGIGDAASVLFTAGYTDNLPTSLLRPVASLPLSVFFQLGTPYPAVQDRAYAAALVLIVLVLGLSITSRLLSTRFTKNIIR